MLQRLTMIYLMHDLGILDEPVLLFGGPYSNLQATLAIQAVANERGIAAKNIICNGDLVAYCANPKETVDIIRDWGIHVVMGNCEESVGNQQEDCACGFEEGTMCSTLSVEWFDYAMRHVKTGQKKWMQSLPKNIQFEIAGQKFLVIHGGVDNMSEFVFSSSSAAKKQRDINISQVDCIVGGHCGIPFGENVDSGYWLNTGVIGMPANDGTKDGWYLLLQQQGSTIQAEWHRLNYDSDSGAKAMKQVGLSNHYRETLSSGLWPSLEILPEVEKIQQGKAIELLPLILE